MLSKTMSVLAVLAVFALPAAADTTLEDILATHLENKGGMKAIKAIESLRIEGSITQGPGMEFALQMEMVRPTSMRMEFTVQGMTGIQAYDGETGWQVMPFAGAPEPQKVTGAELDRFIDQADFDGPLIGFEEKGDTVEYLGTEEVDGAETYKVKLTKKTGDESVYFLDTQTCLEIKSRTKTTMQGMDLEIDVNYSDYKEVAGVMMWHSMTQAAAGTPMNSSVTFNKIEANVDIAADRFKFPERDAAPEPAAEKADGE